MPYYVYIATNFKNTVLYTGVTNDLCKRLWTHREKLVEGFTRRYNVWKLVYFEETSDVLSAIAREKQIKAGPRQRKVRLVEGMNPSWRDLYRELCLGEEEAADSSRLRGERPEPKARSPRDGPKASHHLSLRGGHKPTKQSSQHPLLDYANVVKGPRKDCRASLRAACNDKRNPRVHAPRGSAGRRPTGGQQPPLQHIGRPEVVKASLCHLVCPCLAAEVRAGAATVRVSPTRLLASLMKFAVVAFYRRGRHACGR
jgi:putative endonuclease